MPETTLPIAAMVAERLRNAVADKPIALPERGSEKSVTISIGIAIIEERGDSAIASLSRADAALYEAKANGRNRAIHWQPNMRGLAKVGL